jgi:predicted transcriptional regulator
VQKAGCRICVLHLWYNYFMGSVTTSIRISADLRARLEEAARQLQSGKNRIITQALEEYLDKMNRQKFLEEARRQSVLASRAAREDEDAWLKHADGSGWK